MVEDGGMKTPLLLGLVALTTLAAAPAPRGYALIETKDSKQIRLWNPASVVRSGNVTEVSLVNIFYNHRFKTPDEPTEVYLATSEYRIMLSCDWRAYRPAEPANVVRYGMYGGAMRNGDQNWWRLLPPGDPQMKVLDQACRPGAEPRGRQFSDLAAAQAYAVSTLKKPEPLGPNPPPPMLMGPRGRQVEAPVVKGARFAEVAHDDQLGHSLFIDWARVRREEDRTRVAALTVLGGAGMSYHQTMALRLISFDCNRGTYTILMEAIWDETLRDWSESEDVVVDMPLGGPAMGALRREACYGAPAHEIGGVAEAIAYARTPVAARPK